MSDVTTVSTATVGRPSLALDHLVVAAATLDQGVAWCEQALGHAPQAGGRHAFMGTHNRILSIRSARFPRAYLEVIAIDPDGVVPARPRWFGLDEPALRRTLEAGPRLIHWVARSDDVRAAAAAFRAAGVDPGEVVNAERATPQGLLRWQISVRPDGRRLADGVVPTLIEWGDVHPASSLPPSGCALLAFELSGLPAPLDGWLSATAASTDDAVASRESATAPRPQASEGREPVVDAGPPIVATLSTARGRVRLESLRLEMD